jgi:hypothetical protein
VTLLKQLDLKDPSLRVALGDSLFALGRWREAEEYASAELKRHIDLSYGPEESGGVQVLHGPLDQQLAASGHHRMYLGQPTYVRLNLQARDLKGKIPALSTNESTQVEEADASFNFLIVPAFRLALAAGGWHSDIDSGAEGTAELELKQDTWNVGLLASANRPWDDNIRTAILGGSRNGGVGRSFVSAIPQRLLLSGAVEQWWYTSHEDGGRASTRSACPRSARGPARSCGFPRARGVPGSTSTTSRSPRIRSSIPTSGSACRRTIPRSAGRRRSWGSRSSRRRRRCTPWGRRRAGRTGPGA